MSTKATMEQNFNDDFLNHVFDSRNLQDIQFNADYNGKFAKSQNCKNMIFKFFKKNFHLIMNKGQSCPCFVTQNGALAVYECLDHDVEALNQLLHFILWKVGSNYEARTLDKGKTQFFRDDRLTCLFNHAREPITTLPKSSFKGQVALKIMGLQIVDNSAKLLIHLDQVRVVDVKNGKEDVHENVCKFVDI